MAFLEFNNVEKTYDGKNYVLKGINLEIKKGDLITLIGPSGCGKSTLLRCLAGFHSIDGGNIKVDGQEINNLPPGERNIGMVFQQYSLFPNMTVRENIGFGLKMAKKPKDEINKKVDEMIDLVGLVGRDSYYPSELSGGQQQRVALGRALVMEPQVLLLDEPLSAIDALLRKSLQHTIRRIQKKMNITTVFVTHDQNEAMVMSDYIGIMNQGKIERLGTPMEIYTNPGTEFAASFIGNYNVYSAEEYEKILGRHVETGVALRPEMIEISREEKTNSEDYESLKGTVIESFPKGNIYGYTLDVNGQRVKIDSLFKGQDMIQLGEIAWATYPKSEVLKLDKEETV